MEVFFEAYGMAVLWLAVVIATVVLESITCDLVAIWFMPGAVVALILSLFVELVWVQALVFVLLSVLLLIFTRKISHKLTAKNQILRTNADAIIGERAVVTEEINNLRETGSIKIHGMVWTARAADTSSVIPEGSIVTVTEIAGIKAICTLAEEA